MDLPKGYWTIKQAERWVHKVTKIYREASDETRNARFDSMSANDTAAGILKEALECGELLAAGIREQDGDFITIHMSAWRCRFGRLDPQIPLATPSAADCKPFSEALEGRTIPASIFASYPLNWVTPVVAQADLANWAGEEALAEPRMRPGNWPEPLNPSRSAIEKELEWFLMGYAVRALEAGKAATRDEARNAVVRENIAPARLAEKVHAGLPAKLKNPDKSKGRNTAK